MIGYVMYCDHFVIPLVQFLSLEAIGGLRAILEARSKQRQMLRIEQQQKS